MAEGGRRFFNDTEFKDVVRTFYEIVTQINQSYKKQKRKKKPEQLPQQTTKKKDEVKQFRRNSFHISIAYRLYIQSQAFHKKEVNIDEYDPTYQSKKMRKNNDLYNQKEITLIEQVDQK